jgi:hypothetical protein
MRCQKTLDVCEPADPRTAATLYAVEPLCGGITTIVDNEDAGWGRYESFGDATIGALIDCGIRAVSVSPEGVHAAQRLARAHDCSSALHVAEIDSEARALGMTSVENR